MQTYEPNGPVILATDLTPAQTARLAETQSDLPGVDMEEQPVRNYPYGKRGAHLFGYVGVIDEDEYKARKREGYSPNDVVGKDGLENAYDRYLHGRAGGQQVEVNASGALVRRLKPLDPVPGNTLVTTIDWRLQKIVEKNLRAQLAKWGKARGARLSGAVVVIDPTDGGVLALASMPEFDPNEFATPIDEKKYAALLSDKLNPLFDRAIGAASPTGSTFKMVTGSGAISSGVDQAEPSALRLGRVGCHGVVVPRHRRRRSRLGRLRARARRVVRRLLLPARLPPGPRAPALLRDCSTGSARSLGIDLPGEYPGNWPTEEWTQRTFGKGYHLEPSDVCQLAIGQGAMQATPLQMANVTATVVNGGTLYRPHIVEEIRSPRGKVLKTFDHEVIRKVQRHRGVAAQKCAPACHKVTEPWGTAVGLAIDGLAVRRQDRHRRNRRRPRREHDLVRRVRAERPSEDRDGGLHGKVRRLRRERRRADRAARDRRVLRQEAPPIYPSTAAPRSADPTLALREAQVSRAQDRQHAADLRSARASVRPARPLSISRRVSRDAVRRRRPARRFRRCRAARARAGRRRRGAMRRRSPRSARRRVRRVRALERRRDDLAVARAERFDRGDAQLAVLLRRTPWRGFRRTTRRRRCPRPSSTRGVRPRRARRRRDRPASAR